MFTKKIIKIIATMLAGATLTAPAATEMELTSRVYDADNDIMVCTFADGNGNNYIIEDFTAPYGSKYSMFLDEQNNPTRIIVDTKLDTWQVSTKKTDEYNKRTGIFMACANITGKANAISRALLTTANEMWGSDFEITLRNAFANESCINGNFKSTYDKWEAIERYNYKVDCTCKTCGKVFDTPEQAREHEKWHVENKKRKHEQYLIRREAKAKIAQAERDEAVAKEIKKILDK